MLEVCIDEFKFEDTIIIKEGRLLLNEGVFLLKGPNGVGKSTFLNILSGNLHSNVLIKYNNNKIVPYFNIEIFSIDNCLENFMFYKVEEVLNYFSIIYTKKVFQENYLIELFKLEEYYNSSLLLFELSKGTIQKIQYIISVIIDSPIIIIDEALENIDIDTREIIIDHILKTSEKYNRIFLIATHDKVITDKINNYILFKNKELELFINDQII